jgi:hypothetical protein
MSWVDEKERYSAIARSFDSAIKLITKDGWVWKVLAALVHVFTVGGTTYSRFLHKYGNGIGAIIASPRVWLKLSEGYLVHEATHCQDMRKAGLWIHPWVGLLPYGIAYIFLPFPFGFAFFRYWLELRADVARWRYELRNGLKGPDQIRSHAKARGQSLFGGAYGCAWLWARRGYRRRAEAVIKERGYA